MKAYERLTSDTGAQAFLFAQKEQEMEKHDNSLITRPTYLNGFSDHRAGSNIAWSGLIVSRTPSDPLCQVSLMPSALGMRKIITFVIMQDQKKLAIVCTQVVTQKKRIRFQIKRF